MLWILEHYCSEFPFLDGFLLVKEGCPNKVERVWQGRGQRPGPRSLFTLGKPLCFTKPQFPICQMGRKIPTSLDRGEGLVTADLPYAPGYVTGCCLLLRGSASDYGISDVTPLSKLS